MVLKSLPGRYSLRRLPRSIYGTRRGEFFRLSPGGYRNPLTFPNPDLVGINPLTFASFKGADQLVILIHILIYYPGLPRLGILKRRHPSFC